MLKDKGGAAALTGFVIFLVLTTLCFPAAVAMMQKIPADKIPVVFDKIDNQFVGILVGIISLAQLNCRKRSLSSAVVLWCPLSLHL